MAVGFQCDGNWMYSGSEDGTVRIWDLRTQGCQREYESRAAVNTVVLHPNQTELISGDQNGNIRVWDLTANSCSCELVPEVDTAVRSLTVMWDGSLVVEANNYGTCYVWRLLRGNQTMINFEPLHKLQAHDGYILKCLLSPEFCEPHRYLATASSDNTVKIWNADGFTLEKTLIGHQRWVWDCVFSVDGAYLITGDHELTRTERGLRKQARGSTINRRGIPNPALYRNLSDLDNLAHFCPKDFPFFHQDLDNTEFIYLEIPNMADPPQSPNDQTIDDLNAAPEAPSSCIIWPKVQYDWTLKSAIMHHLPSFHELPKENPIAICNIFTLSTRP